MQTSYRQHVTRHFTRSAIVGLAAFISSPLVQADPGAHYSPAFLRHAERAMERGAPERAVEIIAPRLRDSLKSHDRAEAQGIICRARLQLGSFDEARRACRDALDLDGTRSNWRFLNNLGVAEMQLGNFAAAEEAFSLAVARSGYDSTPRKNLSLLRKLDNAGDGNADERLARQHR